MPGSTMQVPPAHIGWRSNDGEARKEAHQRLAVVLPPGKRSLQVSTAAQTSSSGRGERVRVAGRSMQVEDARVRAGSAKPRTTNASQR